MPAKRILILGGTAEARIFAGVLLDRGLEPISSLAGVTADPHQPPGRLRKGGFGGADGLVHYCQDNMIAAIVDATHPFATQISRHAFEAAKAQDLPLVRFERPGWYEQPGDHWIRVPDTTAAVQAIPENARVLLTVGRKEASLFFKRSGISGIARMIEPPAGDVPPNWTLRLARPPFMLSDECALMKAGSIDWLVCKDAGGDSTRAKLDAARQCGIPVVMIMRPRKLKVPSAHEPAALADLLDSLIGT